MHIYDAVCYIAFRMVYVEYRDTYIVVHNIAFFMKNVADFCPEVAKQKYIDAQHKLTNSLIPLTRFFGWKSRFTVRIFHNI